MRNLFLIAAYVLAFSGKAQVNDALFWAGAGAKLDITKDLRLDYEFQTRFNKNFTTLTNFYNELSLKYDVVKGLNVGLSYRYARKNREAYFVGENRLSLNVRYGYRLDMGLKFSTRVRYQHAFDRLSTINNTIVPDVRQLFRWKGKVSYRNKDFKRVQPWATGEWFANLKPSLYGLTNAYRLGVGVDFDLPARNELMIGYMYEKEFRQTEQNNHIYVIQYTYYIPYRLVDKKKG
ncbi:MAG: DUF2490 domain-containing protein [Crocinitomicaceae bacterium]|nr:DUF2490 domain-containing protein [Crocinitomicaceae bacterium]